MATRNARVCAPTVAAYIPSEAATQLADRLHSAAIHLLRRLRHEDSQTGLSGPRLSALSVVVFAGPVTLGELAAAEQVRPPTMTRLVRALVTRGLVTREPDARDGRIVRLRATPKGRTLMAEGRARRVRALACQLEHLDAEQLAALYSGTAAMESITEELRKTD